MDIKKLSQSCAVSVLQDGDIPELLELCLGNPQFYRHCPPLATCDSLKADMRALPPGKGYEDKFYLGFRADGILCAVMDLIVKYPNVDTAFIGFFMVDKKLQGNGLGSRLFAEIAEELHGEYKYIRLGYVKGNEQSEHFWLKNGFEPTGVVAHTEQYDIVVLQKTL